MPIYEYSCRKGHRFERLQSFSERALRTCPTCRSKAERLISNSAVIFRGSGWYCKDSKKKNKNGVEKKSASSDTTKPPTDGGSKPEKKTTAAA